MVELDAVMEYLDETFSEYRMYLEQHAGFYGNHKVPYNVVAINTAGHEYSLQITWYSHSVCCGAEVTSTLITINDFDAGRYDETFIQNLSHPFKYKRVKDGLEVTAREYSDMELELLRITWGRQ